MPLLSCNITSGKVERRSKNNPGEYSVMYIKKDLQNNPLFCIKWILVNVLFNSNSSLRKIYRSFISVEIQIHQFSPRFSYFLDRWIKLITSRINRNRSIEFKKKFTFFIPVRN